MKIIPSISNQNLKDIIYYLINSTNPNLVNIVKEILKEGMIDNSIYKDIILDIINYNPVYLEKINQNGIILSNPQINILDFLEILQLKLNMFKYLKYSTEFQNALENINTLKDYEDKLNKLFLNLTYNLDINEDNKEYFIDDTITKLDLSQMNNPISSGFKTLDTCLKGGFFPVRIYVVAGHTGSGKSSFLRNLALNIAQSGKKVFFVTLEMTALESLLCFVSSLTQIPVNMVTNIFKTKPDLLTNSIKKVSKNIFIKEYLISHNILDLVKDLEKIKLNYNFIPDVLIIDYADYYANPEDWGDYGKVYDTLKSISRKYNFPIITASQTNRESYIAGGESQLSHIANSIEKIKKAECVLLIRESPIDKKRNQIRMFVGKNRFGISKVEIIFNFNKDIFMFSDAGFKQES